MIRCLFHQRALRRSVERGETLSDSTRLHIASCPACRLELPLENAKATRVDAPPFLHARIMNSVRRESFARTARLSRAWKMAPALAVAVAVFAVVLLPKRHSAPAVAAKPQPWKIASFSAPELPEAAPLETELANLQADTMNAAKALADNFLPSSFLR